jgi:hypothetical protein
MISSRAKPLSARSSTFTRGQAARMRPTMRAISSTAPALASMFARRSFAASRWSPQNT